MLPKVSCLCPTFARVSLLEEAIESFHRQDYAGKKELIVLNDFPLQRLSYEHREVVTVNAAHRFENLGQKRHALYKAATGDYCMTWGDDDIHLPWRITRMVQFALQEKAKFALEGWHYVTQPDGVFMNRWSTCGAHIVERDFYMQTGGIPNGDTGEDIAFNEKCKAALNADKLPYAKNDPAFVYRWHGTNRPHISGTGSPDPYFAMMERATAHVREGAEPYGDIQLQPTWRKDYLELVKEAVVR